MSATRSDSAVVEARRSRLLELLSQGKTQAEAADILKAEGFPADRRTIWRDVRSFSLQDANASAFDRYRADQLLELAELKAQLMDNRIKPDRKVELALSIIDREIKLLGTAAPTKSIQAHISANDSQPYMDFKRATAGLDDGQLEEVHAFARALPRVEPEKNEAWFPPAERKAIEGDAE